MDFNLPTATFIGVALAFTGAAGLVHQLVRLLQVLRCRSWQTVDAEVTHVLVHEEATTAHYGNAPGQQGREGPTSCWVEVEYRFRVGDATHTSRRVRPGPPRQYGSREQALAAVASWPVGTRVRAYYSRRNPKRAVLDRTVPAWLYVGPLIAAAALVAGMIQLHEHPIVAAPAGETAPD